MLKKGILICLFGAVLIFFSVITQHYSGVSPFTGFVLIIGTILFWKGMFVYSNDMKKNDMKK